jgi:hypothetical protein
LQKNGYSQGSKRRVNNRTSRAQREDSIRRTVYVSDIDQQVRISLGSVHITAGVSSKMALPPSRDPIVLHPAGTWIVQENAMQIAAL